MPDSPERNTAGSSQHKEPNSASPERALGRTPKASSTKHGEGGTIQTRIQPYELLGSGSGAEQGGNTGERGDTKHTNCRGTDPRPLQVLGSHRDRASGYTH